MTEHAPTLGRPLPRDLAAGETALIQYYQKYPVFSWPWAWRRTVVYGSFTMLAGFFFGATHGVTVKSAWEGAAVAATSGLANLLLVAAGPMLASLVRHARLPRRVETVLVVAAVLCGIPLAIVAGELASDFHDAFMAAHGLGGSEEEHAPHASDFHERVIDVLKGSYELFVLFVANGGIALAAYFSEPRRWAEHLRREELEKESLRRSEADLRLTVLQAQVEPHFLFNTLASVRSLIGSDPPRAARTIEALARHLRATLPKIRAEAGVGTSTLGAQFAICESYLELMRLRLGERLRVDIRLPDDLREAPFPPLLLISLVENAITHGVEPKPGDAHVVLAARLIESERGRELEVSVEDDGAGLELGMGEGTGLANVREQLRARFGTGASLELASRAFGGVLARVRVPLET